VPPKESAPPADERFQQKGAKGMAITTLGQLAELVHGTLQGDPTLQLTGAATLDEAAADQISFIDHPKLQQQLMCSQAGALLVPPDWPEMQRPVIRVASVRQAFARIVSHFHPSFEAPRGGISPLAVVDPSAVIEADVEVHAHAVIGPGVHIGRGSVIHSHVVLSGRCVLGEQVTIYPHAVLYRDTLVGNRCVLHAGAVLGAYGFGYDTIGGRHLRGDQLGWVVLEEDVEVGANTTIDRGTYGPTVIGTGTKIDNLVMIAHNCRIGRHNLICSQVGVAGSSSTGDYVVMAGQAGVPDHVRIGHRAILGAKAGIMRDVPDDTTVIGIPATPERDQMVKQAAFAKLPEMRKQLRDLVRTVEQLSQQIDALQQWQQTQAPSSRTVLAQQQEAA
jgi:UDP-3-O-[3-hydroxymyristoyl] glucosamine N-acyltransferase